MTKTQTKAIADSVSAGSGKGNTSSKDISTVARNVLAKALNAKECYENNIHARKAVDGKAAQAAKAKLRFFSRSTGDEILDGPAVQLYRHPSAYCTTHTLIRDEIAWLNIAGEFAQWGVPITKGGRPKSLHVLDPTCLTEFPYQARSFEAMTKWVYNSPFELVVGNKVIAAQMDLPIEQVALGKLFNPNNKVRGLSPMTTGCMEISTNYFANRFNAAFFQNGATSDIIVRFPKGTRPEVAEAWVEEWQLRHSIFQGNGFRIAAVIGDEMQIETPAPTAREGQFLELKQSNAEDIGGLFGVPPSVMGFLSKTRFDTIDVELESFAENTLMPEMLLWSEVQQTQVIDPYFQGTSAGTKKQKAHLGSYMKKQYEYAMDTRPDSDIIILLDPDTLPIMAKLMVSKFELMQKIRDAADLSASEAAEYVGIDIPNRPERDDIWVPSTRQNISKPKEPAVVATQPQEEAPVVAAKEVEVDKIVMKALLKAYRKYRTIAIEAAERGEMYKKTDVFALFAELPQMVVELHKDYMALRAIIKSEADKEARIAKVKEYFNLKTKVSTLRHLAVGE